MPGFRKSPRLDSEDYFGPLAAHVIIVTRMRRALFADDVLAAGCLDILMTSAGRFQSTIHAFCFMPDHLHILAEVPPGVSLEDFVHHFKTRSGYFVKKTTGDHAWQTSYYDHILRREEALNDVANYIWSNPATAGLVEDSRDYKWSGPRDVTWEA